LVVALAGVGFAMWSKATSPATASVALPTSQQPAQAEAVPAPNAATSAASPNPPTTSVANLDLKARVQAFQRAQGLTPDGVLGPLTFMQMERALGMTQSSPPNSPPASAPK
jgi:murein L,D-transpeptidase YcbB/YkuD